MKLKYFLPCLCIVLLSISCQKKEEGSRAYKKFVDLKKEDILSPKISSLVSSGLNSPAPIMLQVPEDMDEELMMSDVVDSVWYVKLGDIPSDIISYISDIEIADDQIYILDGNNNNIYVFDISGNFVYSKRGTGFGPGEFSRASSFAVNRYRKELVVHDGRMSKILYYTLEGEYLREHRVGYRLKNFAFISDTLIAVDFNKMHNDHISEIRSNQLAVVDTTWKVLATGGGYNPDKEREYMHTGDVFARRENELFYYQPYTSMVYKFENLSMLPYCQLDFGKRTLPDGIDFNAYEYSSFSKKFQDYTYMVGNGVFSDDIFYVYVNYKGWKPRHVFRSNTTGKVHGGRIINDMKSLGFYYILCSYHGGNTLVSHLSSEEIYDKKELIIENSKGNKLLTDLVTKTKDSDNPVLIFYKLRTDY